MNKQMLADLLQFVGVEDIICHVIKRELKVESWEIRDNYWGTKEVTASFVLPNGVKLTVEKEGPIHGN